MIPLQATQIADQLGGKQVFAKRVATYDRLREEVESGLPAESVSRTLSILPEGERKRVERSFRVDAASGLLDPPSSERLERVARIIALARATYENDDDGAISFLTIPNRNLGRNTPLERALSELGARQVEDLLVRIAYGFPS